jgi:hypothetical protein
MTARKLHLFLVIPVLAMMLAGACGGGEMVEPEPAPAEEAPAEAAAPMEMIGGGHATLVHEGQAGSPHVNVHWSVGEGNITVTYGRPHLRDRVVGESVEPMADRVWRLGADEATTLVTDKDMMIRDAHIPAGEYTLWAAHMGDEFHLIVNSQTGQWGTQYDSSHDVAHIPMDVEDVDPPADQLTLSVASGMFKFEWGEMAATVPIMVHD